jgi:hypothetical protein
MHLETREIYPKDDLFVIFLFRKVKFKNDCKESFVFEGFVTVQTDLNFLKNACEAIMILIDPYLLGGFSREENFSRTSKIKCRQGFHSQDKDVS